MISGRSGDIITKLYTNNKGLEFTETPYNFQGTSSGSQSFADYDNDGDLDLIIPEAYCDIYLYKNNGSASFTSSIIVDEPTNSFNNLGSWLEVVDLNNDGKKDMILSTSLGNTSKAYFYINTSSNNSGPYTFVKTVTPSLAGANYLDYAFFGGSRSTIFEDIDGNGVKDVYCAINGSSTDRFTGWVKLFIDGSNNVTFTKHPIIHLGPLTSAEPNGRPLS